VKVGDLVKVKVYDDASVWHEFMGKTGVIISTPTSSAHLAPTSRDVQLMILGVVAEFDLTEIEVINESK
jgi:hypothetical protein